MLGGVQRLVRALAQLLGVTVDVGPGNAGAQGHGELAAVGDEAQFGEALANLVDDQPRLLRRAVGQHREKLLATVASQAVDAPQPLAQQVGQCADDVVAGGVAVVVVDPLEVVDVEHHHTGAVAAAQRAFQFDGHLLLDIGVLEQAGQAVAGQGDGQQARTLGTGKHRGDQRVVGNGLGDEVVTGLDQGVHLLADVGLSRQVDDRNAQPVVVAADDLRQLGAAAVRHVDVEQHHFRVEVAQVGEDLRRFAEDLHQHARIAQHQAVAAGQVLVVVGDQHAVWLAALLGETALQAAFQLGYVHGLAEQPHGPGANGLQLGGEVVLLVGEHQQRQRFFQALAQLAGVVQPAAGLAGQLGVDDQGVGHLLLQGRVEAGDGIEVLGLVAEVVQRLAHALANGRFTLEDVDGAAAVLVAGGLASALARLAAGAGADGLFAERLQGADEVVEPLLLARLAFHPAFGMLFQLTRLLAELGETEGAGAAGQAVQLVAQFQQHPLALDVVGLQQQAAQLRQVRQLLAQALAELLAELLQVLLQGLGYGAALVFIHGAGSRCPGPGPRAAWGRRV